jgi:GNAT superfamily N-acetyltransferase
MTASDFDAVAEVSRAVYPASPPWSHGQLQSHLDVFAEGQQVALLRGRLVAMAASLIVLWDDYSMDTSWRDFTDAGMFTNHDAEGHTLYGAEIMVHPSCQGQGVGKRLYAARRDLVRRLGLWRIRAGARLSGYHHYAEALSPEDYTVKVIRGELSDPTLTFQLKQGFEVIGVARNYLRHDPESLGHAAVIEWLNPDLAAAVDVAARDPRYRRA